VTKISIFRTHLYNGRHKRAKFGMVTFRVYPQRLETALGFEWNEYRKLEVALYETSFCVRDTQYNIISTEATFR
jgi:hypothetical protein